MPKIGIRPEDLSSGGSSFNFKGRGRIVASKIVNHLVPNYPPIDCGYLLSIQRLDNNWKPTIDEPVDEFVKCGQAEEANNAVAKFHPGKAASADDDFGGVEPWGNEKYDMGEEDGAEGNQLLVNPDWNKGPDKKSKAGIFGASLVEHGVKPKLLLGFAPDLVGLEAEFDRFMMDLPPSDRKKKDGTPADPPTVLIIGRNGQVKGGETKDLVHKYPDAQTGGKATPITARSTPAPPAGKKVNGAASETAGVAEPEAQAPTEVVAGTVDEQVETTAIQMLTAIGGLSKGQTITRAKLGSRLTVQLAQHNVDTKLHPKVKALVASGKDSEGADWLTETVSGMGWAVVAGADGVTSAVTTPAA